MITDDRRIQIVKRKIEVLENTLYDAELDVYVAKKLKNEQMEQSAVQTMKNTKSALDEMEATLYDLEHPVQEMSNDQ